MEFKDEKLAAISKAIEDVTKAMLESKDSYISWQLSTALNLLVKQLNTHISTNSS